MVVDGVAKVVGWRDDGLNGTSLTFTAVNENYLLSRIVSG